MIGTPGSGFGTSTISTCLSMACVPCFYWTTCVATARVLNSGFGWRGMNMAYLLAVGDVPYVQR